MRNTNLLKSITLNNELLNKLDPDDRTEIEKTISSFIDEYTLLARTFEKTIDLKVSEESYKVIVEKYAEYLLLYHDSKAYACIENVSCSIEALDVDTHKEGICLVNQKHYEKVYTVKIKLKCFV